MALNELTGNGQSSPSASAEVITPMQPPKDPKDRLIMLFPYAHPIIAHKNYWRVQSRFLHAGLAHSR